MKMCDACGRLVPDSHEHLPSGGPIEVPPSPADVPGGYTYPLPPMQPPVAGAEEYELDPSAPEEMTGEDGYDYDRSPADEG